MTGSSAVGGWRRFEPGCGTGAWPRSSAACDTYSVLTTSGSPGRASVMVPAVSVSGGQSGYMGVVGFSLMGSPTLLEMVAQPDGEGVHRKQQDEQHDARGRRQ